MSSPTYVDSSALVKLVVREPESAALRRYLRSRQPLVSSALARTEVLRALLPGGEAALARGRQLLARVDLVRVGDRVLAAAGVLEPLELRSLDAVHIATARQLQPGLSALVSYDERMCAAARELGLRTSSPR